MLFELDLLHSYWNPTAVDGLHEDNDNCARLLSFGQQNI